MRILLINPPYPVCESLTMPLGLLYLAARLEEAGNQVFLEDIQLCRSPIRRIKETLKNLKPQIVGVTSFSINLSLASKILHTVKLLHPGATTVWGGPHVSFDDEEILHDHPWVDVVVRGEGEETLVEVADEMKRRKGLGGIPGITWKGTGGSLHRNHSRPFRPDLDHLPRPAWHLLKLSQYRAFGDGASIMTSRGCPHRCVFCVGRRMIGARGRFRSPFAVVDEMEALVNLGFKRIRVEDDLFTYRKDHAVAICKELARRRLPVRWRAYARVDTVDRELLRWMKRAGCERILFGAESGSPEILKRIRKGITPEQTRQAVEIARKEGVGVLASFVLGLPGETLQTLRQTLEMAGSLKVPYALNLLTPYVGTEVRERAEEWGIQILSSDWRHYGQGRPLTATQEVKPWHLSRAVNRFRRGLRRYLKELVEGEKQGTLGPENAEELEKHRHWDFLRRLIGGEILERFGNVPGGPEGKGAEGLTSSLAPYLRMPEGEVGRHLGPHIRDGHIIPVKGPGCTIHWSWAAS